LGPNRRFCRIPVVSVLSVGEAGQDGSIQLGGIFVPLNKIKESTFSHGIQIQVFADLLLGVVLEEHLIELLPHSRHGHLLSVLWFVIWGWNENTDAHWQ
jgi:hypothetical protein